MTHLSIGIEKGPHALAAALLVVLAASLAFTGHESVAGLLVLFSGVVVLNPRLIVSQQDQDVAEQGAPLPASDPLSRCL